MSENVSSWRMICRKFADEVMKPHVKHCDLHAEFPDSVHKEAWASGIIAAPFPTELGGQGLSHEEFVAGVIELSTVCFPMTWTMIYNRGALQPVIDSGSPEQQDLFVTQLLQRGGYAAVALTELEAGSNLMAIKTRAVKTDSGWLLNGAKCVSGNAPVADLFLVLADTVIDSRRRGLSLFIVPRKEGVVVGDAIEKSSLRCMPLAPVSFQDVVLDPIHLIGKPGDGEKLLDGLLSAMRIGGAAGSVGVVAALLAQAMNWVGERRVYPDVRLDTLSHVQLRLARLYVELYGVRKILEDAAVLADKGLPFSTDSSIAKYAATELAVRASNESLDLFGWRGVAADYDVEKLWRDARALPAFEGSNEIQLLGVFREMRRALVNEGAL